MMNSKKKIIKINVIVFCLLFVIFISAYNINHDNLWFDEILSFWITDPKISTQESFIRHKQIEAIPFLYHYILKKYFMIFSYDSNIGRYSSLIFNFLGVIFATLLCKNIKKNNAYLLALFLFSTNIFLISYSQELRPYSLIFFLSSLNLYLFFKAHLFSINKNRVIYTIIFTFSQILMIISHPFTLIIFFSTSLFLGLSFVRKQNISKILLYSFYSIFIFASIYLIFFIKNLEPFPSWITQPDIKFYTNFYFSKFFGSRLMGLIHLILLFSLIVFYYKKINKNFFDLNVFIIIIFLSYFLPIMYGFFFEPIIFPRYIIFVLIPIIILLSVLIFEIKKKLLRNLTIFFIVLINIGNHFSETTFKQFYKARPFYKPNFYKMTSEFIKSETKYYTIIMNITETRKIPAYLAINNYINSFKKNREFKIEFIDEKDVFKSDVNRVWLICLPDVVIDKCNNMKLSQNDKIILKKDIPGIKLILIQN